MLKYMQLLFMHSMNECGASAERRYWAAKKMYNIADSYKEPEQRLSAMHMALDVILCEGKFSKIPKEDSLHRAYWELGHAIAIEIKKHQKRLDIQPHWFCNSYEEAKEEYFDKNHWSV